MRKKTKLVLALCIISMMVIGLLAGCSSGSKPADANPTQGATDKQEVFVMKGGHNLSTEHPYHLGMVKFAELMKEKSNGRIDLQVFPSTQLGNERDVIEALQLGSVDVTLTSAAPLSNFTNDFMVFDFPYIFDSREQAYKVLDGEIGKKIMSNLEQYNLIGLEFMENGFYNISSNKPIEHPADMKGFKVRSLENPMQVFAYNTTGANALPMAFGEVFTALQNKTLDGTGLTYSVIGSQKLYTVQKYVTDTWHFYAPATLLMSKKTYDKLPDDLKQVVRESAAEARDYQRKVSKEFDDKMIAEMEKAGTTFIKANRQEWIDTMVPPTYEKYVGEGKEVDPKIYDAIKNTK